MIYRKGVFYLIVVVDASEKSEYDPIGALGIDLGIENIAVDSDRQIFESKKVEQTRKKYSRLRSQLQKVGTKGCVSIPPFRKESKSDEAVLYREILFRLSNKSSAVENSFDRISFCVNIILAFAMSLAAEWVSTKLLLNPHASSDGF